MIKIGDFVKVTGTTNCGGFEKECIKIGTICKVIDIAYDEGYIPIFCIAPLREFSCNTDEYWYSEKDVEKGHFEWIKE